MHPLTKLFSTVVNGGYCIGCGACTALQNSPIDIRLDEFGRYQALVPSNMTDTDSPAHLLDVCPFSDEAKNETELCRELFGSAPYYDHRLGPYLACYAGYVIEADFRARGSSGGVAKWVLAEMLRTGLADAVIQVRAVIPEGPGQLVYEYAVMDSVEQTSKGSKSVYYPVEMSGVLDYIRNTPKRFAITGVPCFIKALRLLARVDQVFQDRIAFCVGIICGHLKSARYAEMLAWQFGVPPGEMAAIDFRKKLPAALANQKGVEARNQNPVAGVKPPMITQDLFGGPYNLGFFQYRACDFCDDVVAETADISVGDAWLPEYVSDGKGTSIVVVRNPNLHKLLETGLSKRQLHLDTISALRVVESQAGGFRMRREGLAYRLHLADCQGIWRPKKRVKPRRTHIGRRRRRIYEMRSRLSEASHIAFQRAMKHRNFSMFQHEMSNLIRKYRTLQKPSLLDMVKLFLKARARELGGLFGRRRS